jgi:hypothetical protein
MLSDWVNSCLIITILMPLLMNKNTKDLNELRDLYGSTIGKSNSNCIQAVATNRERKFMLCSSCFWCASSYICRDNTSTEKCPSCQNERVSVLLISNGEIY